MGLVSKVRARAETERSDPREFALLARKMGLRRAGVGVVRRLAAVSGKPAVALLVSEYAFLVAMAEQERAALRNGTPMSDAERRETASVRHQLFAER